MNAQQLKDFLVSLEKVGNVLSDIEVNFRHDYNSDVIPLRYISEYLPEDFNNNKLTSIRLMHTEEKNEEWDENCWGCNGSGEGMWDGSSCGICGGSGVYREDNNI